MKNLSEMTDDELRFAYREAKKGAALQDVLQSALKVLKTGTFSE